MMCKTNHMVREVKGGEPIMQPEQMGNYLLRLFSPFAQFEQEEVWVFLFNARSRLTHELMLYRGIIDGGWCVQPKFFEKLYG